ncbi:hypothetical protein HC231_21635 [Brenneria izadpanahii]|uniref:Transcriptional regulator n=1 Tax=Brenneria izadpanahii TaxID=2722756 RepID=A0ABX7V1F7_9GAMM|nr:hypothetical protein [Brenneria izadpanahii]QTF10235.1 hypothetical protein HC231_21635 [Brenneria izadpanahii]
MSSPTAVKILIAQAETLTNAGLHRRAVRLWRNIAIHPDATEMQREQAWQRVEKIQMAIAEIQKITAQKKHQEMEMKKERLEKDRLRILDLFSQGYTPVQVRMMTGRSRSFVSECRKKVRRI